MTYAIIDIGGHQLRVEAGRFYTIDYLSQALPQTNLFFQRILLLSSEGKKILGKPWIKGSYVQGKVLYHYRSKKVRVYKMQPKKKTRRLEGHRQLQTRIYINSLNIGSDTNT